MKTLLLAALTAIQLVGCQSGGKNEKTSGSEARPVISKDGPLWGYIESNPKAQWQMSRAWAYLKDNKIVVQVFGTNAPEDCFMEDGSVKHVFEENDKVFSHLTLWLPIGSNKTPFTTESFAVSFTTVNQNGQETTIPADKRWLTIDTMTDKEIIGTLTAENSSSQVAGRFTATFCRED